MANEINLSFSLAFSKGGSSTVVSVSNLGVNVTGTRFIHHRQSILHTAETAINTGTIGGPGYMVLINRSTANLVDVRRAIGEGDMIRLQAGEIAVFRCRAAAPVAQATGATVQLEVLYIEA